MRRIQGNANRNGRNKEETHVYPIIKRSIDIVVSAVLLVLLLPLMVVIAAALCSFPPRRVLFRQRRVGKNDKIFTIYKFYTLYPDALSSISSMGAAATPLGAILRSWSIDELPQLWNVLKGDMSFVGPRPVVPEEGTLLLRRRQLGAVGVRPGMTGLAQVRGRKRLNVEDKARCDAYYCKEMSASLDLYILWRTLFCVHCKETPTDKKALTNR